MASPSPATARDITEEVLEMAVRDDRESWAKALIKILPEAELVLDVRPFLPQLESEKILNPYEYAEVEKESNNRIDRVRLVFRAAAGKDIQYIKKFVEILDNPGTEQWARLIREQVEPAPLDHGQPLPEGECGRGPILYNVTYFFVTYLS